MHKHPNSRHTVSLENALTLGEGVLDRGDFFEPHRHRAGGGVRHGHNHLTDLSDRLVLAVSLDGQLETPLFHSTTRDLGILAIDGTHNGHGVEAKGSNLGRIHDDMDLAVETALGKS